MSASNLRAVLAADLALFVPVLAALARLGGAIGGFLAQRLAIRSISTRAPWARPVTPTQVRAGRRFAAK